MTVPPVPPPVPRQLGGRARTRRALRFIVLGGVLTCLLLRVALDAPAQESAWLATAILAALPWSLALMVFDPAAGFGDRAAWLVAGGIAFNLVLLALAARWLLRRRQQGPR